MKYASWLWSWMRGIRWNSLWRILVGTAQVGLSLAVVLLSRRFIDVTIRSGSDRDMWLMAVLLAVLMLCGVALRQIYYYMSTLAQTRQSNRIRLAAFSRLFSRRLFDGNDIHSGDVSSRLAKDIELVSDATTSLLPSAVVTFIQLAGAFVLLYSMDRWLAVALLLLTPLVIVFGKLTSRPLRQMTLDIRKDESRIQVQVQEGMEHNATLRSLGSEQWVTERLGGMQEGLVGRVKRRTRFTVATRFIIASCFTLGYLTAFIWGGVQLRSGAVTFGVMTAFLQLVSQIQNPILTLLNMVPQLIHTTASIDRLEEVLQTESGAADTDSGCSPAVGGIAGVRAEDLSFRYAAGERAIFDHFSHDFKPGSKTALIGATGIGKTTLFRLMLSLVEAGGGRIVLYDGLNEFPVSKGTRGDFVFVPQGNSLMSGSVRFNLQLARPSATDEELREVLHTAMGDFVFDLPSGLDTELGERGVGLSEGQAQRIAIARGLLRPGSILLLDEISAALDENTEQELFRRLFAAFPDRTMILITHRPAVAALCDETIRIGIPE